MSLIDLQSTPASTRYHLSHLGIIEITGQDASQFLQGQLTCNINELDSGKARIAAFCNPKGRVISTILVINTPSGFWMILPSTLLDKVLNKLKMYVLRSKVQLNNLTSQLQLTGLSCPSDLPDLNLPKETLQCSVINKLTWIKLPSIHPQFLGVWASGPVIDPDLATIPSGATEEWRYLEISAGLPWFDLTLSEQYIPQMLNIDLLGGVSFNKGCYTGQEVVARTHYLGKVKRQLFLGEYQNSLTPPLTSNILDAHTQEKLGDILAIQSLEGSSRLLMVLQAVDAETKSLILDDAAQTTIKLIPFQ